jgi:NAD(P)H-dependent flavin oxidoreductase YrpB (nitropropane dioxygenase family)
LLVETNLDAAVSSVSGGGGGVADWTANEKTAIRSILGIPASGTTPDDPAAGILDTIRDAVLVVDTYLDTEVAAIKAETASIQSDTNDIQSRLPAALTGAGNMKADSLAISGSTAAADNLEGHALRTVPVTFTGGSTTTAVLVNVDGAAASSTDDVYNGRILVFSSPSGLKDQACSITDYVGATKTATITAVTTGVSASSVAVMA